MTPEQLKYANLSSTDLLLEDRFLTWLRRPTPEEDVFWAQVAAHKPAAATAQEEARAFLSHLDNHYTAVTPSPAVTQQAYARWQQLRDQPRKKQPVTVRQLPRRRRFLGAVAAVLVAALSVWMLWPTGNTSANGLVEFVTDYGEQREIYLPDSSRVLLNADSRLWYAADWTATGERRVNVSGEAFFSVRKDVARRPFLVLSEALDVRVLGTEFSVYAREPESRVILEEGSVEVQLPEETATETILMVPGDEVVYTPATGEVESRQVEVGPLVSWKDGYLFFDDEPLGEVVPRIEEIFGVTITIERDELRSRPVHLSTRTDDLDMFFSILQNLSPDEIIVDRSGREIKIY
ncbi:MAG: FecR domain-containing protein [Bacteroidota bacterium]